MTAGKWEKLKKEFFYDRLFHLALIVSVRCEDGSSETLVIEKNQVINISKMYKKTDETQVFFLGKPPKEITLDQFVKNGENSVPQRQWFVYDGFTSNCQRFMMDLLSANDMLTNNARDFIFQDMSEMMKRIPSFAKFVQRAITDASSLFIRATGGNRETSYAGKPGLDLRGGLDPRPKIISDINSVHYKLTGDDLTYEQMESLLDDSVQQLKVRLKAIGDLLRERSRNIRVPSPQRRGYRERRNQNTGGSSGLSSDDVEKIVHGMVSVMVS